MERRPRFGPAGVPPAFRVLRATLAQVPSLLDQEGLDAFEYEAVRWGKKPQIRKEEAEKLGLEAQKHDVFLSVHASYFMNFCGTEEIVEASKQRLVAAVVAAKWMGAGTVVFHPGVYGKNSHETALKACSKAMREVVNTIQSLGAVNVKIGPETMGRTHQVGSLGEILDLCESVDQTRLVVDWSHLHARERGRLRSVEDFRRVIEQIENRLGTEATKTMHCHFTKIEFTRKGERRHHTLEETRYGPDFRMLAKAIVEFELTPVIISESPILDLDAIRMREILREEISHGADRARHP